MYEIGIQKKKSWGFRKPKFSMNKKLNMPLTIVAAINVLVYIATLFDPNIIYLFAIGGESVLGVFTAYTFNFTHVGFLHLLFNMLALTVFAEQIQRQFYHKKWVQWFLYFVTPLIIGCIMLLFDPATTVGYSGVVLAVLTFGVVYKMSGYKSIAIQLIIFHIILLVLPLNVSLLAHGVGAVVGLMFALFLKYEKVWSSRKYQRTRNWREKHGVD